MPPGMVERYYSATYPFVQASVTRASNLTSIAWFDLAVAAALIALIATAVRDFARLPRWRALSRVLLRAVTAASVLVVLFMATWGLNYHRESLRQKVVFNPANVTREAALRLAHEAVAQVNAGHAGRARGRVGRSIGDRSSAGPCLR